MTFYCNYHLQKNIQSHYYFKSKKKMGQEQFKELSQKAHEKLYSEPLSELKASDPQTLVADLLKRASDISQETLSGQDLHQHVLKYLEMQAQIDQKPKRRRSYELIQVESKGIEEKCKKEDIDGRYKQIQQRMECLEEIEEEVRMNITELMATQKPYKIRQTFRKLILKILNIENLMIYVVHSQGRLQFHDFKNNYITEVLDSERLARMQKVMTMGYLQDSFSEVMELFDLSKEVEGKQELFKWNLNQQNTKFGICYVWKSHEGEAGKVVTQKIIQKIVTIAMISTSQEQTSIIKNYSKDLLQILQIFISQMELSTACQLGFGSINMETIEKQLLRKDCDDQMLLLRIVAYQQLQFELLERIRMYKKYVCESDKIFMEFDQSAELTFLSCNFSHPYVSQLPKLWQRKKLFLQKIFPDNKPITQFLKKAMQQKIKPNKLYQLDFESKVRIKYNDEGTIVKLHIIVEQLQNSSSSSTNIYTTSSKNVLSDSSDPLSLKFIVQQEQKQKKKDSTLMKNLQKDHPGIINDVINEGWINLFIKDDQIDNVRKNTYFKTKQNNAFHTKHAKRSFSLNRSMERISSEHDDMKMRLQKINVESIDLNLLELDEELLQPFVLKVCRRMEYYHGQNVNKEYFGNFLTDLHNGYQTHNNPFHNFTHGVNVMHTSFLLANSARVKQLLTPYKIFIIVFSGLCHDVGHTGFTNLFQIASGSKKAVTYNDSSPLQNYHAAYTFELLKKPENAFLKDLSREEMKDFRQSVIRNILYTDIKEHFPLLQKFDKLIKDEQPKNDEYLNVLSNMIVHTADFGGSAKQFDICKAWSLKVNLQFSNQYKQEGELGLPQTPFMKDLTNISILSKNEGGFLKVIVMPLYQAMDEFCGSDIKIRNLREYTEANIAKWQSIHAASILDKQKQKEHK